MHTHTHTHTHTHLTPTHITHRFLRQVQDETLRLSTLAPWAARYSDEDVTVCGYKIPKKTPMIHALGVSLKNQTVWDNLDR